MRDVITPRVCWRLDGATVDFLRGNWQADRVITDHRSGQAGVFQGVAAFVDEVGDDHGGVIYQEEGELRFGRYCGPASRTLLYLPLPGGAAAVRFADGRPFYRLDLRAGHWQAEHPCGQDRYLVTVRVLGSDSFSEQWQAAGPGKDYEMTTSLTRIGASV